MKIPELEVKSRDGVGTVKSRELRRKGEVPAVLYGLGKDARSLSVPEASLRGLIKERAHTVNLKLEGKPEAALMKEVQVHTLSGEILHVDFHRVDLTAVVKVSVKVVLKGVAAGTMAGGVLEQQLHKVELECLPTQIPDQIVARIEALEIGASLFPADLNLPEGVKMLSPADHPVATVHKPKEEAPAAESAAPESTTVEPEVIGQKEREERAKAKEDAKGAAGAAPKKEEGKKDEGKKEKG